MEEQKIIENNVVEEFTLTNENEKPKKSKKKLIIIITAIVLAVAIALGSFFIVPLLLGEPRKKFESEEQMKEFVMGTWFESEYYDEEQDEWIIIDGTGSFSHRIVISDGNLFEYDLNVINNDLYSNPDSFFNNGSLEDFLTTKYENVKAIRLDYKKSAIINEHDVVLYTVSEDGKLIDGVTGTEKFDLFSEDSEFPVEILTDLYESVKSMFGVPEETVIQGLKESYFTRGPFTESIGNLLNILSPDYEITVENYEDVKDKINLTNIEWLESNYSEYLDRTYLVTVNGRVLYNTQIPNYYSENQEIMSLLLVFDENDEKLDARSCYVSDAFYDASTIVMCSY